MLWLRNKKINFSFHTLILSPGFNSIPTGIEQEELQAQRAKELKLVQQKAQRREIVPEISFNFPNMNQLCLPVAVPVPCNKILRKSEVMERLRNKVTNVTPYKKIHKQEVPTMPQTPVEEMQKLQIMLGTSDRMAKDEHDGMYCLFVLILYISVNSFGHVETGAGQNIPCHFLTPRTKHPTKICHPGQNISCCFCHPGHNIPCCFCHPGHNIPCCFCFPGQNIPCHFCLPGQNIPHSDCSFRVSLIWDLHLLLHVLAVNALEKTVQMVVTRS